MGTLLATSFKVCLTTGRLLDGYVLSMMDGMSSLMVGDPGGNATPIRNRLVQLV